MFLWRFVRRYRHALKYLLVGASAFVCLVVILYRSSSKYVFKVTVENTLKLFWAA